MGIFKRSKNHLLPTLDLIPSNIAFVDYGKISGTKLEEQAKHEFNVEHGPYGKEFITFFIKEQLASGEVLSYGELAKNGNRDSFYMSWPNFNLALLGGLLVLTEQQFLSQVRNKDGKTQYSLLSSIRNASQDLQRIDHSFFGLKRGQTLNRIVLDAPNPVWISKKR